MLTENIAAQEPFAVALTQPCVVRQTDPDLSVEALHCALRRIDNGECGVNTDTPMITAFALLAQCQDMVDPDYVRRTALYLLEVGATPSLCITNGKGPTPMSLAHGPLLNALFEHALGAADWHPPPTLFENPGDTLYEVPDPLCRTYYSHFFCDTVRCCLYV